MAHRILEQKLKKKKEKEWAPMRKGVLYIFMHLGGRLLPKKVTENRADTLSL